MKSAVIAAALLAAAALLPAGPAAAKGCLKGAAVGGVAGHFLHHHAVIGTLAGCAIGHHEAKKHAQQRVEPRGR